MLFLAIFIHQTHSPNPAAPSMAMLPPPGQEQNNQDRCINTSIFSLTTHLTSTKPLSHNWNCCFLPWGLVSVCCNTRHGPALGCVWPWFPSPGLILIPTHSDIPHLHDGGMSGARGLLMPRAGAAIAHYRWWTALPTVPKMLLLLPDGHPNNNGKGQKYSLLCSPVARRSFLDHWPVSLCPKPLSDANTLSTLSELEGPLRPLGSSDEQPLPHSARGAQESPCPGMGSTSPDPDFIFPTTLLLPL